MDFTSLDESFINNALDDSFLLEKSDEMDDEVVNIIKKWNSKDPSCQRKNIYESNNDDGHYTTFSTKTFTRPKKSTANIQNSDNNEYVESKLNSNINLQVGGPITHSVSMKKSWLGDVSPPNSIESYGNSSIMKSLITSSDFSNISGFLLNDETDLEKTITPKTMTVNRSKTFRMINSNISNNATFSIDTESPMKEFGVENVDTNLSKSIEDLEETTELDFDCLKGNHDSSLVQSTPIHQVTENKNERINNRTFDAKDWTLNTSKEDALVPMRKFKSKFVFQDDDGKRESLEDQYEFLLNEETIKLSTRMCKGEQNVTLVQSEDFNEKEFDNMLDSLCVSIPEKSENHQISQSLSNIRQKYSVSNNDKKQIASQVEKSNIIQSPEKDRLLKRGRLYDDINFEGTEQSYDKNTNGAKEILPNFNDNIDEDRFKTIKLCRKTRNEMADVDPNFENKFIQDVNPISISSKSEINLQQNHVRNSQNVNLHGDSFAFKKPVPSRISKFGMSKPKTDLDKNEWKYSHKANSIDNLDNTSKRNNCETSGGSQNVSKLGVKSKSINNLLYSKTFGYNGSRTDLKLASKSGLKLNYQQQVYDDSKPLYSSRTNIVGPSSGYFNGKSLSRMNPVNLDSNRQEISTSSSSKSSSTRQLAEKVEYENENHEVLTKKNQTGAIPRPSGLRQPTSIPRTSLISGLPRPNIKR